LSTEAQTQTGQEPRETPQTLVQESIRYRRRAQEAERRAESLETEIQSLRDGQDGRAVTLESDLAQARAEALALRRRLETTQRDRRMEREFARAGCVDPETALALARERLADADEPADLPAFVRGLLDEKPHLRPTGAAPAAASLPPRSAAPKPAGPPVRTVDRLAERARATGNPGDLAAYMKARRSGA
jgi:hypothetical protein